MFIEDVILDAIPVRPDGAPDPAYIETPVPPDAGFYHPRWDGAAWTEGLTPEEIAERQATAPPPDADPGASVAQQIAEMAEVLSALLGVETND